LYTVDNEARLSIAWEQGFNPIKLQHATNIGRMPMSHVKVSS